MRLIDADALMKKIAPIKAGMCGGVGAREVGTILTAIEHAPTVESPRPDWTPCAALMPKPRDGDPCYITVMKTEKDGKKHLYVVDGYFDKGIWFDKGGWKINSKGVYPWSAEAIAWKQNLVPEPYNPDHIVDANKKIDQICPKCNSMAHYDPYFGRVMCRQCGWTEEKK